MQSMLSKSLLVIELSSQLGRYPIRLPSDIQKVRLVQPSIFVKFLISCPGDGCS